MHFSSWTPVVLSILTISATAVPTLEVRKNGGATAKAAKGGPASAKVTVYNSYTCVAPNTAPPTDGSVVPSVSFSVTEGQCTIPNSGLQAGGALTATLTASPATGALGCYIMGHSQQGCGVVLSNYIYGWPMAGTNIGDSLGCGSAPAGSSWSAFEILCE